MRMNLMCSTPQVIDAQADHLGRHLDGGVRVRTGGFPLGTGRPQRQRAHHRRKQLRPGGDLLSSEMVGTGRLFSTVLVYASAIVLQHGGP